MNRRNIRRITGLVAIAAICVGASTGGLAAITVNGSSGTYAASATFDVVGGNLQITLANTSLTDVTSPTGGGGVLTALFFDLSPTTTLTPISALLGAGSTVFFDSAPPGGNVGGEWAFAAGLSGVPGNAGLGNSSAGFGLFGAANFNGVDLDPPAAINGLNYGITSAGDDLSTGNAAVTGTVPLIQNSVVFTLSGNPAFTTIEDYTISNVSFQYGTDLTEPNIPAASVPEPTAGALFVAGSMLLLAAKRRLHD